jgi:hypothetical protein
VGRETDVTVHWGRGSTATDGDAPSIPPLRSATKTAVMNLMT